MKRKLIIFLVVSIGLLLVGCDKNESNELKVNKKDNKIKTVLSCYHDFTLFHSKQHIENKIYLDNNNKLVDYEYKEVYFEFDSENEYTRTCDGLKDEALNNTKIYDYLTQTTDCNPNTKEVTISNKYDISKVNTKGKLEGKNMKEFLSDDFILDLESYKNSVTSKGYICK